MKKKIPFLFFFIFLLALHPQAQQPVPASSQTESLLFIHARIHVGNGSLIQDGAIAISLGKIDFVADASMVIPDKNKYTVIDVSGKDIYPGFIAPNTIIGLSEIEMVRSTRDFAETGSLNPNVRAIISYNTDSKVTPTVRSNGILLAQIVPQGGTLSGESSVVELDAWNWEDAAYKTDDGLHLNWPRMTLQRSANAEAEEQQRSSTEREIFKIKSLFNEAKSYLNSDIKEKNLRFESMRGLFTGSKKLFVHCDHVKEITAAVYFAREFGLKMVLVGGADAWRVTDLLKENNVPVIIGRTHALPLREDDDTDLPYKLPALLKKSGVKCCLSVDGFWQVRNLPFMAGTAAEYGLSKEEALMCISSETADILGIGKTCGSLEKGKDATLFISSGDALDMKTNQVEQAFIRGKKMDLNNIQTALNKKYRDKYGLK